MSTTARTAGNNLVLLALATIITSCAQVAKVHTPAATFMTAETSGKALGGKFQIAGQSGTEGSLVLESDEIENSMELRNNVTPLSLGIDLGIFEKMDIFYRSILHESPGQLGMKFQLLGKPRNTASKGNHSLAITFSGGSVNSTTESDELFDDDDDMDFKSETTQTLYETGLIYSYRNTDDTVVYSGLKFSKHNLDVEIEESDDPSLEGKEVDYESTAVTATVGLTRYFSSMYASVELSGQQTNWTNNEPTTFAFLAAAFGWHWE